MIQLDFEQITMDEKRFVDDLIQAIFFDIVNTEEIRNFIEYGMFPSEYDIYTVYDNEMDFPHPRW